MKSDNRDNNSPAHLEPLKNGTGANVPDGYEICNECRLIIGQFDTSFIPVTVLNKDFIIVAENNGFVNLIGKGKSLMHQYFPDICASFDEAGKREDMTDFLKNPKKGFSWKGIIEIRHEHFLTVHAACSIMTIRNAKRNPENYLVILNDITDHSRNLVQGTFLSLLEASKQKDNDTGAHIQRVGNYSRLIAEYLYKNDIYPEITREFIEEIFFLAQMHDVGKIGVPDDILHKEGPLTDWEWTVMKEHTINGGYILHSYPNPIAQQIAQFHHEKWNGDGYPFQLTGDDIPVAARIVAIADVYDAMRTKRSYKKEISHKDTVEFILENRGIHFDPAITKAFHALESEFKKEFANSDNDPH